MYITVTSPVPDVQTRGCSAVQACCDSLPLFSATARYSRYLHPSIHSSAPSSMIPVSRWLLCACVWSFCLPASVSGVINCQFQVSSLFGSRAFLLYDQQSEFHLWDWTVKNTLIHWTLWSVSTLVVFMLYRTLQINIYLLTYFLLQCLTSAMLLHCSQSHCGHWTVVVWQVTGKCGSVLVRLIPAPRGTGIVSAPVPKKLLHMAGIDDCYTAACGQTATLGNFGMFCDSHHRYCYGWALNSE